MKYFELRFGLLSKGRPVKTKIGTNRKIEHNKCQFQIQSNTVEVLHIKHSDENIKYVKVRIKDNFKKFIEDFETFCKGKYKGKFNSYLEGDILTLKVCDDIKCFDRDQFRISKYDFKERDKIIVLLETSGIWVDENSMSQVWKIRQLVKL